MQDNKMEVRLRCLLREQLYQSAAEATHETRTSIDVLDKFYRAIAMLFTNKIDDALSLLTPLSVDPLLNLSAILASIHIYKHFKNIDIGETIAQLEATLRSERKKANEKSLYYAALFLHLNNRQEKAKEYVEKALNLNSGPNNIDSVILKGWIELMSNKDKPRKKSPLEYFESAISVDTFAVEAHQGKIRCLIQSDNFSEVFTSLNQMISSFPNNQEFLVEKLRAHLAAKDWDAVSDSTKKINNISNPFIVKILEIQILATICHDGSFVDATPLLKKLFSALEKYESTNGELFVNAARLFSRVCGRHIPILNECQVFVEKAIKLDEKNASYLFELAQQQVLQSRFKEALATLKKISQIGETSVDVMLMKIHCLLHDDQFEAAQQQLNIVEELHYNTSTRPTFQLAKAMLLRQTDPTKSLQFLKLAYQLQIKNASGIPYGVEYLSNLNPDFLLSVAEEYFEHHGPENSPQTLLELSSLLASVVQACPGLLPALYRLANANFIAGDYRAASATLHHIIDHVDPTYIEAYLLMAEIGINQNNLAQAAQYLEMGLSYNFQVRDHPRYHLLLAKIQRQRKDTDACLSSIRMAMILSGMRPSSAGIKRSKYPFTLSEKAVTYLELFHVLMDSDKKEDAGQIIQEALHELRETPQEGVILLAEVDHLLNEDDVDGALMKLKALPDSHPQHLQAQEKMADIYLHRLQDEALYLQCYRDIVRQLPNVHNLTLLGDAHLALHQVDQAVSAYEDALKLEPRNFELASKIGAALILTHQYTKALNYYKDALRNDDSSPHQALRIEYATLLYRLGQLDKAEKIISDALLPNIQQARGDADRLMQEVKLMQLLAKIHEKSGNQEEAISSLRKCQSIIGTLVKKVDQSDHILEQRKIAANIAIQMAGHALSVERDMDAGIRLYREALSYSPDDIHCMAQLAKVYLQANDVEHCQYMCKSLLKIDRENDQAQMMVAQIALRKNDLETATLHFRQAIERQPCHYEMLGQFIDVCRRRGNISDANVALRSAEVNSAHGQNEPGLSYCRGLYEFYSGQYNVALLALNRARGHAVWGQYAIRVMLDICLNGDSETLENVTDLDAQYEVQDTELMALHTAAKLLQELSIVEGDEMQTHILYPNLYLLATRQKSNVERALSDLTTFANKSNEQDNPGIVFGIATAHLLLKQTQRARNQLKRLIKAPWTLEEGEYLERCWLLLSDIYIQAGQNKMEIANELLRRVLTYNRSCAKAYEYLGYIMEKEQSFREAAEHFENAWKLTNQSNALVGYKLALSYLKAKQYPDAIDISQSLLTKYPNHPRIRKDVLEKAIANLRS